MKINMDKIEQILENIKSLDQKILNDNSSFGEGEQQIKLAIQEIGKYLVSELVSNLHQQIFLPSLEDENGINYQYVTHTNKPLKTVFDNVVNISRAYYYNKKLKKSYIPWDKKLGIDGLKGLSPVLTHLTSYFSGEKPYEKARIDLFKALNVKISTSCVQKNAEMIGRKIEEYECHLIPLSFQQSCDIVYISIDGTGVPTVEGECREAKTVTIERVKDNKVQKWYISKIAKINDFKPYLERICMLLGVSNSPVVVVLGDGAGWIDGIKNDLFPNAIRIIDFYHAVEYIYKGCDIIYGKNSELGKKKADDLVCMLREGEIYEVINELIAFSKRMKNSEELKKVIGYFNNHKENMDYEKYEIYNGYKIGSGSVEGACKYIVGVRFKRNGMRWTVKDANAILALRVSILNEVLEKYFEKKFRMIA